MIMEGVIRSSELIINSDGSVYHLGLKPSEVADKVIVVGDPARVELIASLFDEVLLRKSNREFHSALGVYKNKKVLAISSGISSDNVDILVNELDALVNIDLDTRAVKGTLTKLSIVRVGTCGGVSDGVELGDFVLSRYAIGGDALLNYYADSDSVRIKDAERLFVNSLNWDAVSLGTPYFVESSPSLVDKMKDGAKEAMTYCAGGFYAPQGRALRLRPIDAHLPDRLSGFSYNSVPLLNIEMEGAAVIGLARLLGHDVVTLCVIVAHRKQKSVNIDYKERVTQLIQNVLERI